MSKEVTVIGQICKTIDTMESSLAESLQGTGISTKRFLSTAKTAIQTHKDKRGLESADRQSLYLAIKEAARDGLLPGTNEAALVVYNNKQPDGSWLKQVQYQPMVQGIVKLMRNSGEIADVDAFIVHKNDTFSFKAGRDKIPDHDADWFGDRGEPIGVWAFVKLNSGEVKVTMLTKDRVMRLSTRSKAAKNYDPKQGQDWEEWWKKAAIRNVSKYAPKSSQLETALKKADEEFDFDDDAIEVTATPVNPISDEPKTESRAARAVKGKSQEAEKAPADEVTAEGEVIDVEASDASTEAQEAGEQKDDTEEDGLPM